MGIAECRQVELGRTQGRNKAAFLDDTAGRCGAEGAEPPSGVVQRGRSRPASGVRLHRSSAHRRCNRGNWTKSVGSVPFCVTLQSPPDSPMRRTWRQACGSLSLLCRQQPRPTASSLCLHKVLPATRRHIHVPEDEDVDFSEIRYSTDDRRFWNPTRSCSVSMLL